MACKKEKSGRLTSRCRVSIKRPPLLDAGAVRSMPRTDADAGAHQKVVGEVVARADASRVCTLVEVEGAVERCVDDEVIVTRAVGGYAAEDAGARTAGAV